MHNTETAAAALNSFLIQYNRNDDEKQNSHGRQKKGMFPK
jgi:hypothetical protein